MKWYLLFPLLSSLLYGWLFLDSRLYGESGLQLFFVAVAVWGWWQWLRGRRGGADGPAGAPAGLRIARLDVRGRGRILAAWALGWPVLALLLDRFTDTDVPWHEGEAYARLWPRARLLSTTGMGHHRIAADPLVIDAALRFLAGETVGERVVSSPNLPFGLA